MSPTSVLEAMPAWIGVGAGAGGGFYFLKWFFEWLGGRVDKREAAAEKSSERVDEATAKLIKHLQDQMEKQTAQTDRLIERVDGLEQQLADCRAKHAEAEAEVMKLKAIVQGFGDAKQQAASIVAAERILDRQVAAITERASERR